ncbi:hypothetical protein [Kitasatospora sp. NPDC091276]|uniref:hypothetical protein n=1 Tax=unclassified Kitasatospora TaxID=2633591 RepID=UPI0034497517
MDSNGSANPPLQPPVININIGGTGTQLQITTPVAIADGGSVAQAEATKYKPSEAGEEPPYWRRTAVVWSAVAALATLAGVAFSAWSTR